MSIEFEAEGTTMDGVALCISAVCEGKATDASFVTVLPTFGKFKITVERAGENDNEGDI